ncbi:MAG TPA: hypothetical protein VKV95_00320 [Terriglobia bacterium]|nr:hypothetical protein [Terriglobia bacterium]
MSFGNKIEREEVLLFWLSQDLSGCSQAVLGGQMLLDVFRIGGAVSTGSAPSGARVLLGSSVWGGDVFRFMDQHCRK